MLLILVFIAYGKEVKSRIRVVGKPYVDVVLFLILWAQFGLILRNLGITIWAK